jgi:hypothetical protein
LRIEVGMAGTVHCCEPSPWDARFPCHAKGEPGTGSQVRGRDAVTRPELVPRDPTGPPSSRPGFEPLGRVLPSSRNGPEENAGFVRLDSGKTTEEQKRTHEACTPKARICSRRVAAPFCRIRIGRWPCLEHRVLLPRIFCEVVAKHYRLGGTETAPERERPSRLT